MKKYKLIHIWEFPPTLTYIGLENKFRENLFNKIIFEISSQQKLIDFINKSSNKYGIKRKYSRLNLYSWIKGKKFERNKTKKINIPLWILIEISKYLSKSNNKDNIIMNDIEKNTISYSCWGKSNQITKPKLPLYLTPEMVSVIFHFVGDGHIGRKGVCSSYRQMNEKGLTNFLLKLNNIFGKFKYSETEYKNGRLNIPKIITYFYIYYFNLPNTTTFEAYIPTNIKSMEKDFLIAGLTSFIVDEGHVGEVITIYSKNKRLLNNIREIAIKCNYISYNIREKYAYGRFDVYRFSISSKSYDKFNSDINRISKVFPTCTLVQKSEKLINRIR